MKFKFTSADQYPREAGRYFWRSCYGTIELITVMEYQCFEFSRYDDHYWGIMEFGAKSVERYGVDQFSEKVEFIVE